MYVPATSVTVKLFVPPRKIGVCPRILLAELISTLSWANGELLVNSIVTFPALAVSLLAVYMSFPDALAAMSTVFTPLAGGVAVVVVVLATGLRCPDFEGYRSVWSERRSVTSAQASLLSPVRAAAANP